MARIRSSGFKLAVGTTECWRCKRSTDTFALVAPSGSVAIDDELEDAQEEDVHVYVALSGIERVSDELRARMATTAPLFRPDESRALGTTYWMNHCQECATKLGDHYLHMEPDGPFFAWPRGRTPTALLDVGTGEIVCSMPYLAPPMPSRKTRR